MIDGLSGFYTQEKEFFSESSEDDGRSRRGVAVPDGDVKVDRLSVQRDSARDLRRAEIIVSDPADVLGEEKGRIEAVAERFIEISLVENALPAYVVLQFGKQGTVGLDRAGGGAVAEIEGVAFSVPKDGRAGEYAEKRRTAKERQDEQKTANASEKQSHGRFLLRNSGR